MPKSWSFSSLTNYERCPHSVTFPYKQTDSPAAQRGTEIHANFETYLLGDDNVPITDDHRVYLDGIRSEIKAGGYDPCIEQEWGYNQNWGVTNYKTAWLRVKVDLGVIYPRSLTLYDWKTGKEEYNEIKHRMQLQLYLCAALIRYPGLEEYNGVIYYADLNKEVKLKPYDANSLNAMQARWHRRGMAMTTATEFPPKPSKSNCRFCVHRDDCKFTYEE